MAKKKKKNVDQTEGFDPQDGSVQFDPTEGFGDTAGFAEPFAPIVGGEAGESRTQDLDELDDVLVLLPEEDEPVSQDSVAFFATETMGDSMPFEDDVLPITGEVTDDMPYTEGMSQNNTYGLNPAIPANEPSTMSGETAPLPTGEGPTRIEDVGLLAQHPDHGVVPVDPGYIEEEVVALPDIEDVEDITSLVEEAVSTEMSAPQNDFDDEFVAAYDGEGTGGSKVGVFLKLAAAVLVGAAGVMFGPDLYQQYFTENGGRVVADSGSDRTGTSGTTSGGTEVTTVGTETNPATGTNPGADPTGPTVAGTTTGTDTTASSTDVAREELASWMSGVVASNFGVTTPDGR